MDNKLRPPQRKTNMDHTWDLSIESDASRIGWGAICQGNATGGRWMAQERAHQIIYLGLKQPS